MTITSNQVFPRLDISGDEQSPGSSDVAWAERAYRDERRADVKERRGMSRLLRRRLRILLTALAALAIAGVIITMRYEGSASLPVAHPSGSSQAVTVLQPAAGWSILAPPPLLRTLPTLPQTIITPRR
jgi:hypothetical protein